jgi:hypothetical protein
MGRGRRCAAAAVLTVAAGTGCGGPTADGVTTLAKADGWRSALASDEVLGGYHALAEIAYDEATARTAWQDAVPDGAPERSGEPREPGVYGDLDDVDFAGQVVVVYSSGQSGACPGWLADISVEDGTVQLAEGRHMPGNGCSDDYNPYRLVLAVDRDRVPAEDDLPTEDVFVDGRDLAGLITAYPAIS